ncbi:hypothetical protein B0H14DRAFT_2794164, partial [Mycena olivaceomarginata]
MFQRMAQSIPRVSSIAPIWTARLCFPTCEIYTAEYELTLPASSRGQLTIVEGLICHVVADLSMDQPLRRMQDPEGYGALDDEAAADEPQPGIGAADPCGAQHVRAYV